MRLARSGYRCAMPPSTTYEEAPPRLCHGSANARAGSRAMCRPGSCICVPRAVSGASSALLASSDSRQWSAAQFCRRWCIPGFTCSRDRLRSQRSLLARPETVLGWPFWDRLVRPFGLSRLHGARFLERARAWLSPSAPAHSSMLLISAAAYRAVWQFMTARFEWEKTEHGLAITGGPRADDRLIHKVARPDAALDSGGGQRVSSRLSRSISRKRVSSGFTSRSAAATSSATA